MKRFIIPRDAPNVLVTPVAGHTVQLTNLDKIYFPAAGFTKGDLLQYYADVAYLIVPYVSDRAMVLKRYPGGIDQDFFYMKRTPPGAPAWLRRCSITHGSGNVIDFPVIDDVAGLLWTINLGCVDLNEWYARCDDTDRPDYVHFDLDPVEGTPFSTVREVALRVRDGLEGLGMKPVVKTTGSSGMHVYVAIVRGPLQKQVWTFAKAFARALEQAHPEIVTAEYTIAKRPAGRVLVDYNQNRWGATLASVYSVRAKPLATVSTPVTWEEVEAGIELEDFRLDNVRERFDSVGDLWAPVNAKRGRFDLAPFIEEAPKKSRKKNPS
ncbi:MAG TPA: non-homologous end-joining DNA ligase [Candidatus Tumulicola sp.]